VGLIAEAALRALAARALETRGVPAGDALDCARILVLGDLLGVRTHGVSRVESYAERIALGGIAARASIRVEKTAPAIARIDGANGLGPVVGMRALREAMEMARDSGIAAVFARASNHFGPIAPYNLIAAESGFASIVGSNATTTIAPTGGAEARLGNSPIGFGIPNPNSNPIILDMAVSVVARAKIREAMKRGDSIPDTWATDRAGRPTTDPRSALDGFLQPIGGYKGYGLALIVDLFAGLLSGAGYLTHVQSWSDDPGKPQDLGHFFIVIDTTRLGTREWLADRMRDFAGIIHSTPRSDERTAVRLPGEIELDTLARQRREGIAVDDKVLAGLERMARAP
jgi:LDH2 family malate/lactate/ureidoglycolate dehydrogenase